MVEQSGRQVLLAAQGPGCWPGNRQMTLVPSWQQLAPNHQHSAALQQQPTAALLQAADTSDWGRHLLVEQSGGVHQDQRSIFPVDLPDVYDAVSVVDHWPNSKRNSGAAHKSALFTLQVIIFFRLSFHSFFNRSLFPCSGSPTSPFASTTTAPTTTFVPAATTLSTVAANATAVWLSDTHDGEERVCSTESS